MDDLTPVKPALDEYRARCRFAQMSTPGGVLFEEDLVGIRRRVARHHGITPEDLARWVEMDRAGRFRSRRRAS